MLPAPVTASPFSRDALCCLAWGSRYPSWSSQCSPPWTKPLQCLQSCQFPQRSPEHPGHNTAFFWCVCSISRQECLLHDKATTGSLQSSQSRTRMAVPQCRPGREEQQQQACAQLCSNIQICLLSAAVIEGVSVIMY